MSKKKALTAEEKQALRRNELVAALVKIAEASSFKLDPESTDLELFAVANRIAKKMEGIQEFFLTGANDCFKSLAISGEKPYALLDGHVYIRKAKVRQRWVYPAEVVKLETQLMDAQARAQVTGAAYQEDNKLDPSKHQLFAVLH